MTIEQQIRNVIRDVPDFPKKGIIFKDITPILQNTKLSKNIIEHLKTTLSHLNIEGVAGIESRGFLFGVPLAIALGVPFIMIRKKGKLPYKTTSVTYDLEYGTAEIEMHNDAVTSGQRILIHDDLLATGGSASAAAKLIEKQNGTVVGINFLIELTFLDGRNRIAEYTNNISSLISY